MPASPRAALPARKKSGVDMNGEAIKTILLRFDGETQAKAVALARANFRKPGGEGNVTVLLRSLVQQAYSHPERFGLLPGVEEESSDKPE